MALPSFLALGASCLSWERRCHIKPSANGLLAALELLHLIGVIWVGNGSKGGGEPRRIAEEGVDSGELCIEDPGEPERELLCIEDPGESKIELPDSGVASRTRVLRSKGPVAVAACTSR